MADVSEGGADTPGTLPPSVPEPPVPQSHHRDVHGGVARAAVFGASDGLVSNVSLILGVAGATTAGDFVRVAGMAGLIAGAVSMAAGEWVSMRAQQELLERELAIEREQIHRNPNKETVELSMLYQSRGADPELAQQMAKQMMADPERALEVHAREELGIAPDFLEGNAAVVTSLVLAVIAAAGLGVALATFTGRSKLFSAGRQVAIATAAALVTYAVGSLFGVSTA